jgi:hypothetical protein
MVLKEDVLDSLEEDESDSSSSISSSRIPMCLA